MMPRDIRKIYADRDLIAEYKELETSIRSLDAGIPIPPPVAHCRDRGNARHPQATAGLRGMRDHLRLIWNQDWVNRLNPLPTTGLMGAVLEAAYESAANPNREPLSKEAMALFYEQVRGVKNGSV